MPASKVGTFHNAGHTRTGKPGRHVQPPTRHDVAYCTGNLCVTSEDGTAFANPDVLLLKAPQPQTQRHMRSHPQEASRGSVSDTRCTALAAYLGTLVRDVVTREVKRRHARVAFQHLSQLQVLRAQVLRAQVRSGAAPMGNTCSTAASRLPRHHIPSLLLHRRCCSLRA